MNLKNYWALTRHFYYGNNELERKMKKLSQQGFTLIELMVVIAIIAILAMVSIGIFSGVQGNARDGRRIAEVNALAKNVESTRDPITGKYTYTSAQFSADYPNGLTDPSDSSTYYCLAVSSIAVTPPTTNPKNTSGTFDCPQTTVEDTTHGGNAGVAYKPVKSEMTAPTADLYFSVCAVRSERGSKPFCQSQFLK